MFSKGPLIDKLIDKLFWLIDKLFRKGNVWKKMLFLGHIAKFRRPTVLQLNIKGLTASKMNVLYYLALKFEALVILLQDTHCIYPEKLLLLGFQLAGSFLNKEHGLATFVHERLRYAFKPISTNISD